METVAFDDGILEQICKVLGDTGTGLTGSEIGRYLQETGLDDVDPASTKWIRVYSALHANQQETGSGSAVIRFIEHAMKPVNYWQSPELFGKRQAELNRVLMFSGYRLEDDGHVALTNRIRTLDEAQQLASNLYKLLESRNAHPDVLKVCKPELVVDNYFHAVLEAAKSINTKIKALFAPTTEDRSMLEDGTKLAGRAFGSSTPTFIINAFATESHWSEQTGFLNLLQGVFLTFRNPLAHEPKNEWSMNEQDALDILSLISYLHRRLDEAVENTDHKTRPERAK